jgi:hypothetical protein
MNAILDWAMWITMAYIVIVPLSIIIYAGFQNLPEDDDE